MRFCLAASLFLAAVSSFGQVRFLHPDRIRYDAQCFTIDGKDTVLYSGAFHYFRCPKPLWMERLEAIKRAGFNAIETYVPWNWSERTTPTDLSDFSKVDLKDFDEFLSDAEGLGLYTIVRPGPYICAEWATGGFPQWLVAKKPAQPKRNLWLRSDDPVFLAWSRHWYQAVCRVVRRHQLSAKPMGEKGTILFQIENEYDYASMPEEAKVNQLKFLATTAQQEGIEIPLFTCWTHQIRTATEPPLNQVFDTCNEYPRWSIDSVKDNLNRLQSQQPNAPKMVTELQGGWFGGVGGQAAEEQDGITAEQINAVTMEGLATGMRGSNYYMLFGGTNFGDWAAQGITTSYDYFAPVREWGGLGSKYRAIAGIGAFLGQFGEELARAESDPQYKAVVSDPTLHTWVRKAPDGARFVFVSNPSRTEEMVGTLQVETLLAHYRLGKFGFKVFRIAPDGRTGNWYPETSGTMLPTSLPRSVRITQAAWTAPQPTGWRPAKVGASVAQQGVMGSEFVFYRPITGSLTAGRKLMVDRLGGDIVAASSGLIRKEDGRFMGSPLYSISKSAPLSFALENPGYPNGGSGMESPRGVGNVQLLSRLPQQLALNGWKVRTIEKMPGETEDADPGAGTWEDTKPDSGGQRILDRRGSMALFRTSLHVESLPPAGSKLIFEGIDDDGVIFLNGVRLGETHDWSAIFKFNPLSALKVGDNVLDVYIRNNDGPGGLTGPVSLVYEDPVGSAVELQLTTHLQDGPWRTYPLSGVASLPEIEHPKANPEPQAGAPMMVKTRLKFHVDELRGIAWEAILKVGGNGFLYLNGHPLGRYWTQGPQRAFYLPECWLQDQNVLEVVALPRGGSGRVEAAEIRALSK